MGQAAYNTTIKISGSAVGFTGEATTDLGSNSFQITDDTKQIFDRTVTPTVYDGGVPVATTDYKIDFLFGIIDFNVAPAGAVTIDGSYLPVSHIGGASSYTLNFNADVQDCSNFADASQNGGYRSKTITLIDASVDLTRFDDLNKQFKDYLENRESFLLEIIPGGVNGTSAARGWFTVENASSQGDVGALEEEDLSFHLDGDANAVFSWRNTV